MENPTCVLLPEKMERYFARNTFNESGYLIEKQGEVIEKRLWRELMVITAAL